jgi:perosamine synthetase
LNTSIPWSRRRFLTTTSSAFALAPVWAADVSGADKATQLAIDGGQKAVPAGPAKWVRWGEPEEKQLLAMIRQPSLFYWKGPQTALLIERFRQHHPLPHVMTCSSGTAAVHTAVAAAGIGPGDEVITTPITDIGTVIGVLYQQGVPVFADLGADTYNLDVDSVAKCITPRTKAIIAVHLAGTPCDLAGLKALAAKHQLILIEDCAQAWGAKHRGRPVGTIGQFACFSLMNSKHITSGDGGVVASNDDRLGPRLQRFADKGVDRLNPNQLTDVLAPNYRMSEPQAAVAAAQLDRLEGIAEKRSRLGRLLTQEISGLPGLVPPRVADADRSTFWFYMLRMQPERLKCPRAQFVKALVAEGVPASAGYIPEPLYKLPLFQRHAFFAGRWPVKELGLTTMDYTKVKCREAEAILDTAIRITLHEAMDDAYVRAVAAGVRKVAKHYAA